MPVSVSLSLCCGMPLPGKVNSTLDLALVVDRDADEGVKLGVAAVGVELWLGAGLIDFSPVFCLKWTRHM